jgi:hypothetical protein
MVERQHTAGIDAIDSEILPKSPHRSHQRLPGVHDKADFARTAACGNEDEGSREGDGGKLDFA